MNFIDRCPYCNHNTLIYCFDEKFIICPDCGKRTRFSEIDSGIIIQLIILLNRVWYVIQPKINFTPKVNSNKLLNTL